MSNEYQILLDEVRQNFASVVWTHKIQEKQADYYRKKYTRLETTNIIVAAVTSCGILSLLFCDAFATKIITAILSFITLSITAYFKSFDIKSQEKQNKEYANKFLVIRNKLMHIICDIHLKHGTVSEISSNYSKIIEELNELYISAPPTSEEAVNLASEALKIRNDNTYTEEEIDSFLPKSLRGKMEE